MKTSKRSSSLNKRPKKQLKSEPQKLGSTTGALANFFDKAALGASQILQNFDHAAFAQRLTQQVVGLAFDETAALSPEGRATLELCVDLLSRLYPRLAVVGTGEAARVFGGVLVRQARAINPRIEIQDSLQIATVCLGVGTSIITPANASIPMFYLGSEGWIMRLSMHAPVGSGDSLNPFGAGAVACFGVANVFRVLFGDSLPCAEPDESFSMSLLDFDPTSPSLLNPPFSPVDLGESHLVGLGAIGSGAVWALSRAPGLSGTLHLIDHEFVELSNLQRYVGTTQHSIKQWKERVAAAAFGRQSDTSLSLPAALQVHSHRQTWGDYLRTRDNWHLEQVAVALDTARDRMELQGSLPQQIFNAWTQTGDLGVSRHEFSSDQACLMCLYLPEGAQKNRDELIAEAIGLPEAKQEIRNLLHTGQPIGREWIERIAKAQQVPVEPLLPYVTQSLDSFYTGAVCGGIVLKLGGSSTQARAEVPMAFQSALAGILLAAEMLAHAGRYRERAMPTTTKVDLLRSLPLSPYLSQAHVKHPSGKCICQDADYIERYKAKYGNE